MEEQEVQDINEEIADIAEAIVRVAALGELLSKSPLKKETIVLLLHKKTGLRMDEVRKVLDAIPRLKEYLK